MVKIRLRRTGAKKKPNYRVVVTDSRTPRDGRFIEIIGHYNPRREPAIVKIDEDRVLYWLSVGAQPTDSVKKLLKNLGTLDRFARLKEGADLEELLAEAAAAREGNGKSTESQPQPQAKAEPEPESKAEPEPEPKPKVKSKPKPKPKPKAKAEEVAEEEPEIEPPATSEETSEEIEAEEASSEDDEN